MRPQRCVWAILCLASTSASAQAPTNVNDCTLLPDPVALKRCVDGFGPQSGRPSVDLPLPAASVDAARPEPTTKGTLSPSAGAGKPAVDWLHDGAPAAKSPSNPNAIKLND
ncbi:MAG: hypothetical protein INR70_17035 [Parafilimonas terrae]|jgi:hypothetical protein|nr:hypothetical protein [Parafilimonas terrae]